MEGGGPGQLDARKAYILATVVYEYVATAEPVASQTLTQKYNLGISSATVRNELADLEAAGYLVQPHTSAGRIPSDAGYRTYVDELMRPENLAPEDRRRIQDELRDVSRELDEILDGATRLLGRLSRNLAYITKPSNDSQTFRHIQLDLAVGANRRGDRRYVYGCNGAKPLRAFYRRSTRRSYSAFHGAQLALWKPHLARNY